MRSVKIFVFFDSHCHNRSFDFTVYLSAREMYFVFFYIKILLSLRLLLIYKVFSLVIFSGDYVFRGDFEPFKTIIIFLFFKNIVFFLLTYMIL